jgi:glycosyltransferase involved in cell wall biosynthesis
LESRSNGHVSIANGGVGVYIYNLIKQLESVDRKNSYHLIRFGPGELDIYSSPRFEPVFLPRYSLSSLPISDAAHRRVATDLKLDLLHYPNQFGGAMLPASIRRIVTLHDLTPIVVPAFHPRRRVYGYKLLMLPAIRAASHVIVDSNHTRKDLIARGIVPEQKVTAVPLAASDIFKPTELRPDFPARYNLPDRFILSVGVLEPRKNHAALMEALRLLHSNGEKVGLVAVGRRGWRWKNPADDPKYAHLREFCRVVVDVPDADLPEFYNRALVFAYPSFYEGFGLPVLEAMACGTPVVASNTSSLPEVAGDAALLVDPNDPAGLAARLLELIRNPQMREKMISAGKQQAARFSWRRCAEQTVEIYERVCASS